MAMNGKRRQVARHALMLVVLSVGLTGCKTCTNLKNKLPFFRKSPEVVVTLPPEVGEADENDLKAIKPGQETGPGVTLPGQESVEPLRPTTAPQPEEALETVHFDYDSAALTDTARRILDVNINWLKANPQVRIQVEGHCDERGTEEYNMNLGARRAQSVQRYLMQNGIAEDRLFTISFGEQVPVDPGHDESAWWKNRRVEFQRL